MPSDPTSGERDAVKVLAELLPYIKHTDLCAIRGGYAGGCNCQRDALVDALDAALAAAPEGKLRPGTELSEEDRHPATQPTTHEERKLMRWWLAAGRASASPSAYVTCRSEEAFTIIDTLMGENSDLRSQVHDLRQTRRSLRHKLRVMRKSRDRTLDNLLVLRRERDDLRASLSSSGGLTEEHWTRTGHEPWCSGGCATSTGCDEDHQHTCECGRFGGLTEGEAFYEGSSDGD